MRLGYIVPLSLQPVTLELTQGNLFMQVDILSLSYPYKTKILTKEQERGRHKQDIFYPILNIQKKLTLFIIINKLFDQNTACLLHICLLRQYPRLPNVLPLPC